MQLIMRKRHTEYLTNIVESTSLRISAGNRAIAGTIVLLLHTIAVSAILWMVIWSNRRELKQLGLLLWFSVMVRHWYFGGCWLVRSERRIWRTKEWYGPWTSLFSSLGTLANTKTSRSIIFASFAFTILVIGFSRLGTTRQSR